MNNIKNTPLKYEWCVFTGGDGWRNFEPVVSRKTVSFTRIDKIIRELRRIYKENPAYFDVPAFAQKVY